MIPVQNLYYLLCYAWDILPERTGVNVATEPGDNSFINLLVNILNRHLEHQIRAGFPRRYVEQETSIAGIRGKLNLGETLRQNSLRAGKTICDFDEFTVNHAFSSILKASLRLALQFKELDESLRQKSRYLLHCLSEVSEVRLSNRVFQQQLTQVRFPRERLLLHLCQLLYENQFVNEETGCYQFRDFWREEKRMAALFEAFVRNFYRLEQNQLKVRRELITWKLTASESDHRLLPRMQTDITLEDAHRKIIIDTKYYEAIFQRHFDAQKLHSAHLYQLFAYLKNQPVSDKSCEGILLYPVVSQSLSVTFSDDKHRIRVETINLSQSWQGIKIDLLKLLNEKAPDS